MGKTHRAAVGLTVAGVCAAGLAFAPAGHAAPVTAPVDCPVAYPAADVTEGLTGTGFTVDKGTTPAPFAAEVLGTIDDGIFPGIDLVVARVDSAAIRAAGGVWSGMSGSPVYTADGRLLGAVAYTLAGATDIAGITPAEDMLPLLGGAAAAARARVTGRATVAVPRAMAARIARASADGTGAGGSFRRIDLPLSVSGSATRGRAALLGRLGARLPDARVVPGGARAAAAPGDPGSVTAGGNFVAALAHGDVTIAGTGTTTVVCDGRVVAFGHPFTFSSPVTMSAHAGSAVLVQPDPV